MLKWRGDEVGKDTLKGVASGMAEFGLRVETAAKTKLQPGHGVKTATLRRSVHTAEPGYNWQSDNVSPSASTPERGGREARPKEIRGKLTLEVGSGLEYAMPVHQGHGSFEGYHFITEAAAEQKPKLPAILKAHASKR